MTPFEAYHAYLSLKQHFTKPNYNALKYGFKTSASVASFEKRKDRFQFQKLSKHPDPINFMVANIMEDNFAWIGELLSEQGEANYKAWLKRQQSLTYTFTNELSSLDSDFNKNFIVSNGNYPLLYKLYRHKVISPETMVILNDKARFMKYWKKNIEDTLLWPADYMKLLKYKSFFHYNEKKFHKILLDTVLAL